MVYMFLNGGGMRGGNLHHLLQGAPLVAETRTSARYRFYAVSGGAGGEYPALDPVSGPAEGGREIKGELYDLPLETLRDYLLPGEPPELEFGLIELHDGTPSFAMVLRHEHQRAADLTDITEIGDWRIHKKEKA